MYFLQVCPAQKPPPSPVPILYKAGMGQGYLELPQVDLPKGQLQQNLLRTSDVYVLDCHSDIFVWYVKKLVGCLMFSMRLGVHINMAL